VVIEGTTTSAALRITQLGTGNALLVEDSTNPDSTPFVINNGGQVIAGRNQVMDRVYAVNPAGLPRTGGYSPNDPETYAKQQLVVEASKAKELHDLATNLVQSSSIEPTESTQPATPSARGSLASSVAKTAVVKQEPMPDPKKSNGPTRI
jgi:hypothetical protein